MLTRDEFDNLLNVGATMCKDMIDAAATADRYIAMGIPKSSLRISDEMTDVWVAIVNEYESALDDLEATGAL